MKRLLVAGLGLIGARHARAVLEHAGAELACVVEPDPHRRADWTVPGFASLDAVDVDVDGAILATPSHLHADHAETALGRGWPCLIEKPVATTLTEADRIVAAAARAGRPVLVGHHRRHHASVRALREALDGGVIGEPVTATAIWAVKKPDAYFAGNWRSGAGGSPVMINAVHDIDLLRHLLGEVVEVAAMGAQPQRGAGRPESGAILLRFESGAIASLTFADTAPSPWSFEAGTRENPNIAGSGEDCLWITGTGGGIAFPSLRVWAGAADWTQTPSPSRLTAPPTDPLAAQLSHFLDVLDGASPLIDAEDARRTLAVTLEAARLTAPRDRTAWAS